MLQYGAPCVLNVLANPLVTYPAAWVSFVAKAHVPTASFYDLWHVVMPGRASWQSLLSEKTAELLKNYPGA